MRTGDLQAEDEGAGPVVECLAQGDRYLFRCCGQQGAPALADLASGRDGDGYAPSEVQSPGPGGERYRGCVDDVQGHGDPDQPSAASALELQNRHRVDAPGHPARRQNAPDQGINLPQWGGGGRIQPYLRRRLGQWPVRRYSGAWSVGCGWSVIILLSFSWRERDGIPPRSVVAPPRSIDDAFSAGARLGPWLEDEAVTLDDRECIVEVLVALIPGRHLGERLRVGRLREVPVRRFVWSGQSRNTSGAVGGRRAADADVTGHACDGAGPALARASAKLSNAVFQS